MLRELRCKMCGTDHSGQKTTTAHEPLVCVTGWQASEGRVQSLHHTTGRQKLPGCHQALT